MKRKIILLFCFLIQNIVLHGQTPVVLRPDLTISQVMNVQGGAVRIALNTIDSSLYYSTLSGNIFKINIPAVGQATDTLLYTANDHGILDVLGMAFYDSSLYVSGNLNPDSALTTGIIMRGDLVTGVQRNWTIVAQTVPYETAGKFDHLFSGLTLTPLGDTILICSGARGDHGEIRTRNGLYPGLRNPPITSLILKVPAAGQNILIPNDSMALDAQGFVFARGIRNTFDYAYNANGDLFGAENSGDRDVEDELNWLRHGKNYGFPWMMGSSYNPQMFLGYDASIDLLINHSCSAWMDSSFYNDTLFPQIPVGLQLTLPCKNTGPNASFMRDSATGTTYNAAAALQDIYSFTPHRSPLGLTFDSDSLLGNDLRGNGFILSYSGNTALLSPFNDTGEDLLILQMQKDTANDTYSFSANKIAEGFHSPVDAVLNDTCMYIIEVSFNGTQALWRIDFPRFTDTTTTITANNFNAYVVVYPNPVSKELNFSVANKSNFIYELTIYDQFSRLIFQNNKIDSRQGFKLDTSKLKNGIYYWKLTCNDAVERKGTFVVVH